MATTLNKIKNLSNKLYYRPRRPVLKKSPQRKGVVIRLRICTPRKPNSARRPVVKLFLSSKRKTIAHIPGSGHSLKRYSKVIISGVGPKDLPGVHYTCIRGKFDCESLIKKTKRRSIYGVKLPPTQKVYIRKKLRELNNL
jgi:small subunit ribosomal protein S12